MKYLKTTINMALFFLTLACAPVMGELDDPPPLHTLSIPNADYGDAPDDRNNPSAMGHFPTRAESNGARHLNTKLSALGYLLADGELPISAEDNATDPMDPDGVPNLGDLSPDQDQYDDGLLVGLLPPGGRYDFPVVVTVAEKAENKPRYINILADWNVDLEWNGTDSNGASEWVVQNFKINVAPGTTERIFMPTASIGHQMYNVWFRVTLSDVPVTSGPNGWDGTGEFAEGETEDTIFRTLPKNEIVEDDNDNDNSPPPDDPDDDTDEDGDGDFDDDDPDGDGNPGVDPNNIRKLKRRIANVYNLVLCKGDTWSRGFEWETYVRNGSTSNPFTATMGLSNDPGTVTIHAVDVGSSRVSFEANTITFPVETEEWVTGIIDVSVILCDKGGEPIDGGGNGEDDSDDDDDNDDDDDGIDGGPWEGIDNVDPEDAGKLVHARGHEYYLVLCLCTEQYRRGFQYETKVFSPSSSNGAVAELSVQNDPGSITVTPTGLGEATLTFTALPMTFPYMNDETVVITLHVKVILCHEEQ